MDYAQKLQQLVRVSGLSQEELARRLGVSFATVNAWINGRSQPRANAAIAIDTLYAQLIGVDSVKAATLAQAKHKACSASNRLSAKQLTSSKSRLQKLSLHLTYHTNSIEGSTMTLADTAEVLLKGEVLANRTQIEQLEAQNHQASLFWLLDEIQKADFVFSEALVLGLHLRLTNGILGDAGQFRRHAVRIMGAPLQTANYLKVPALITVLLEDMNHPGKDIVSHLADTHAAFEKVHPFSDGNGRIGRLLMLAQALRAGLTPPLVLREKRQAYYAYLNLAQMRDTPMPLELFVAEAMQEAAELLESHP